MISLLRTTADEEGPILGPDVEVSMPVWGIDKPDLESMFTVFAIAVLGYTVDVEITIPALQLSE